MRGHIRRRGKKWAIVLHVGYHEISGKHKYKWFSGYNKKKEAEEDLPNKLKEIQEGVSVDLSKETVAEFLNRWLEYKKGRVKQRSYEIYARTVRLHILDALGKIELRKLKPQHLSEFYHRLQTQDEPLSNRYISQIHTLIHDALETAVAWELISRNIADKIDPPKPLRKEFTVWTIEKPSDFWKQARITVFTSHSFLHSLLVCARVKFRFTMGGR